MFYNDLHVQQAFAFVRQHQELTEVLKIQLHVTENQDPEGAPLTIDPVVQAAIKPVDNKEENIPAPIPSERGYSSHASLALGIDTQETYSRLSRYLQSVVGLDMIRVEANGNCLFSSIHCAVDCQFEYQTVHLSCQLVMMMAHHHNFLFPILKASITTTYGFP